MNESFRARASAFTRACFYATLNDPEEAPGDGLQKYFRLLSVSELAGRETCGSNGWAAAWGNFLQGIDRSSYRL
jgi:hypothetical protein